MIDPSFGNGKGVEFGLIQDESQGQSSPGAGQVFFRSVHAPPHEPAQRVSHGQPAPAAIKTFNDLAVGTQDLCLHIAVGVDDKLITAKLQRYGFQNALGGRIGRF